MVNILIVWVLAQRIEVTNEDYVLAQRWVPNLGEPVEYQNRTSVCLKAKLEPIKERVFVVDCTP